MPVRLIVWCCCDRLSVRRCAPAGAGRGAAGGRGIDFDALRAQAAAALTSLQQSREARVASVATTAF
ncbi:MAG: hypothetical protein WCE32_00885 [Pseudolabrys sp.]